jgi:WD40 repeat protein
MSTRSVPPGNSAAPATKAEIKVSEARRYSPFQGLMPYDEKDAPFFFGREESRDVIIHNLKASRLTVLYGASGVGKSSILRAGVIHFLHQQAQRNLAAGSASTFAVVLFNAWCVWRDNPLSGLIHQIETEMGKVLGGRLPQLPDSRRLDQILKHYTNLLSQPDCPGKLYIILDQFEEYFLYRQQKGEGSFAVEFSRAINCAGLGANFLISIRADALDKLDAFRASIPSLFSNLIRLKHLDQRSAADAIRKPIQAYNRYLPEDTHRFSVEPELIKEVLDQVQVGKVAIDVSGRGDITLEAGSALSAGIETPYLQMVLIRLWQEEIDRGSFRLRLQTFNQLGGAERIVEAHLKERMNSLSERERNAAACIFEYLVTRGGSKIAYPVLELVEETGFDTEELKLLLEKLSSQDYRLIHAVGPSAERRYEIFHDVLARVIAAWRKTFYHEQDLAKEAAKWQAELKIIQQQLDISKLELTGTKALQQFDTSQLDALLTALEAGQKLQATIQDKQALLNQAPTFMPNLRQILDRIQEQHRIQIPVYSNNRILSIFLNPDKQHLAVILDDNTVQIMDFQMHLLAILQGHTDYIWRVKFSNDGSKIATTSMDGTVRLWDMQGHSLAVLKTHQGLTAIDFSPDGQQIAISSMETATVWLRNLHSSDQEQFDCSRGIICLSFNPTQPQLIIGTIDGAIKVWDLQEHRLTEFEVHTPGVISINFSPDGQQIVTGAMDGSVYLWDLHGKLLAKFKGHESFVTETLFSPDGQQIATASTDGTVCLWDLQGNYLTHFKHRGIVSAIVYSSSGEQLITTEIPDGLVHWWNLQSESLISRGGRRIALFANFAPTGQQIATVAPEGTVYLWDLQGRPLANFKPSEGNIWLAVFSPDGQQIATSHSDFTVHLWDLQGHELAVLQGHTKYVNSIVFSPDGQQLATASMDETVRLWNLSGQQLTPAREMAEGVLGLDFSPDGQKLAMGLMDGTVQLDLQGHLLTQFQAHALGVTRIRFSPDGLKLLTASWDGTVYLWNLQGEQLAELKEHRGTIVSISFSPDGRKLLTVCDDGSAGLWDDQGNLLAKFTSNTGGIRNAQFTSDGLWIETVSLDITVQRWRVEEFDQLLERGYNWLKSEG